VKTIKNPRKFTFFSGLSTGVNKRLRIYMQGVLKNKLIDMEFGNGLQRIVEIKLWTVLGHWMTEGLSSSINL
ncbi:MAG TPA: hypothetical protein VGQ09_18910, partial [Chitinophagaceae bacterium]|nr:hypothetical protein [Chitinophagaceae bacterium]